VSSGERRWQRDRGGEERDNRGDIGGKRNEITLKREG
jgi:hypothetical protein